MNDNQTDQKTTAGNQSNVQKQGNQNKEHQHDYKTPVGDKNSQDQNQHGSENKGIADEKTKNQDSNKETNTNKNQGNTSKF